MCAKTTNSFYLYIQEHQEQQEVQQVAQQAANAAQQASQAAILAVSQIILSLQLDPLDQHETNASS